MGIAREVLGTVKGWYILARKHMHAVYELNIRTWRSERSRELGRPATLDDLDNARFDRLVEDGFTWLYLLGLWPTGPLARAVSQRDEHLQHYMGQVLDNFTMNDIAGSVFSPAGYTVEPDFGGEEALARLRERARASGLSLMLDFVPNHVGLDHPWVDAHPDWFIPGTADLLWSDPFAYVRRGDRVLAHGRDPFFPPWRSTVQLDYGNPVVQEAVIHEASAVAARCDGLRCDVAMLLLPDVFQNTWKRPMEPFWRRCLDRVRAEHPGTLFMAEVYWNREWELQQQGFDFTYDKMLYDRLRDGEALSVRAHLRAAADYQSHCVRFLENHEEARAAAAFPDPAHHRAALLLTGMVPGMLLCHDGQEDGRVIHSSMHASRRPREPGSPPHREAYQELIHLLSEPARKDGKWHLLENRGESPLIAVLWQLPLHHSLLVVMNCSPHDGEGVIDPGPLGHQDQQFHDRSNGAKPMTRSAQTLAREGIPLRLPPWGVQVWRVLAQK